MRIVGDMLRTEGPNLDWTLLNRVYDLQLLKDCAIPLFGADGESVFEQHQCFVRFGSDLPPGKYTVHVTREDDVAGYLLLSRTTPGLAEQRGVALEPRPHEANQSDQNQER